MTGRPLGQEAEARTYDVLSDEGEAQLHIILTDEGVIADLIREGDVVATWGATAQELTEEHVR